MHRSCQAKSLDALNILRHRSAKPQTVPDVFLPGQLAAAPKRRLTDAPGPLFRELAEERMAYKRLRLRPRSFHTDAERLKPLLEYFGALEAAAITPAQIDHFFGDLLLGSAVKRKVGASTANRYMTLLSSIFEFAVRNGRVAANPAKRVERFHEAPGRCRVLSEAEEVNLRAAIRRMCPAREPELDLALYSGMRRGEQWGLEWSSVDFQVQQLTIRDGKTGRRYVPMHPMVRAALVKLRGRDPGARYVCARRLGAAGDSQVRDAMLRDRRGWFEHACKRAGVADFHWHDLRHTCASRLVMAGVDSQTVQQLLGHKSPVSTARYTHLSFAHLRDAVAKLTGADPQGKLF